MFAIKFRHISLVLAAMILPLGVPSPAQAVGPTWPYEKILNGQYPLIPLKNQAMITRTKHGYLYRAGQQDSHLVITRVERGLRFRDSGTRGWKSIADACRRQRVAVGVAAVCPVPSSIKLSNPMLLEVWPRLGDDFVDGSTLPAPFQMAVLADAGRDVVLLGAGDDFVNGAMDADVVRGGAGDDWIRTGPGDDNVTGGPGDDKLVGSDGRDTLRGGHGNDSIYGDAGNDRLYAADSAADVVSCGSGRDIARVDRTDRARSCEAISRR